MRFRLTYNVTRQLSLKRTIIGTSIFIAILVAIAVVTAQVKGGAPGQYTFFSTVKAPLCNDAIIYSGQTFGGPDLNSTYTYMTTSSYPYHAYPETSCALLPNGWFEVLAFLPARPTFSWGMTVQCVSPYEFIDPGSEGVFPFIAQLSVLSLNHINRDLNVTGDSLKAIIWLQIQALIEQLKDIDCNGESVTGFGIDFGGDNPIWLIPSSTNAICTSSIDNSSALQPSLPQSLRSLADAVEAGIAFDFGQYFNITSAFNQTSASLYSNATGSGKLFPLPGLVYSCVGSYVSPARLSTILIDIYTTVSASWGILLFAITFVLVQTAKHEEALKDSPGRADATPAPSPSSGGELYPLLNINQLMPPAPPKTVINP